MPGYAFRSIEERRVIERMWNDGKTPKEIAAETGTNIKTIYDELVRGCDGKRLPNCRLRYSAEVAQMRVELLLEWRGKRSGRTSSYDQL